MSRKQIAFKDDAEDHIHQHCPPGIWLWVRPTQDRILGASESHGQEGFVETEKPLCIYCTHSHTCAHICTDIRTHTRLNLSRQMAVNCVGRRALRWPRATFQSSICFISSPRSLRFQVEPERKPWRELHISEGKVGVGAARAKLGPKFMTLSFPTPNSLRTLPKRKGGYLVDSNPGLSHGPRVPPILQPLPDAFACAHIPCKSMSTTQGHMEYGERKQVTPDLTIS